MFSLAELESYLDESLPPEEMAKIEKSAREDPALVRQLASIHARRDAGVHTLGEIWRERRLGCPTRDELGRCLAGTLPKEHAQFVVFHVEVIGCRYCQANLADLRTQQTGAEPNAGPRRRKFFQSSVGYLKK
jgi:hypothetical protein